MDSPRKKGGKLARAVRSLPLIHFDRDVDAIKKSKSASSSPKSLSISDKSLSASDNTPKNYRFTTTEKTYGRITSTFAYDGLNTTCYNIFSFKLLDDGMIYCKGLFKSSIFSFSYDLVGKCYEGKRVVFQNDTHAMIDGECNEDDVILHVYSRDWERKNRDLSKRYPVYITSRQLSTNVAKFIEDHYYIILMWFE